MRVDMAIAAAALLFSHAAAPAVHETAEVVAYTCKTIATGETQAVQVDIQLTVPTDAQVNVQMTIGWRGSYVEGRELMAPDTGLEGEVNLYAYVGISGFERLTSATGVGSVGTIVPGEPIPLPVTTVELKTTASVADEGTVRVAAINFGSDPQNPAIECEVANTGARTEYPLRVPGNGQETTPSTDPTSTETTDPDPTTTEPTTEPTSDPTSPTTTETPEGGPATGGGGEAGPDGRILVAVGLLLALAAAAGLWLRRPAPSRR
ncbi:hypothetical protein [Nonomuraea jiangxiensis]|uniref:LPXTG-motif cell wall anchor domain-containing protein n=1 Tax=Nonomuraea jiangxiensis TaxID=633440 RepID=A0A1G9A458_9ACTN|nr:hypothetical protein [Nonomuraea jiangxiensis]SDK21365.1 hypothetical protein SAMN05421869_114251 [Nonomuraea jiangxiensis]